MNEKKVLLAGGLLYLGLSFALFNASPEDRAHKPVDGMGYHKIAMRFVEKGTLLSVSKSPLNHPIGYPFVLGLCYKLWGNEVWKIVLFQVFLMLLSLVIWYYIIKRLFDPQIAQYTYFLSIINLGLLIYPQLVLVESGQFFLYTLFFERLSQFYNSTKEKILLQAGFFLGLSVWLKPSALYFPLYCMPFLLVMWFLNRKNILYFFTYFAVGFYVPVGLYSLYNYSHFGYIKLSYIPEYGQYYFLHSKILKQINPSWSESKLRILIHSHFNTNYIRLDSRYWQGGALFLYQTCLQHPVLVLKHVGLNVVKTLIAPCITQWKIFLDPTSITPNTVSFFYDMQSYVFSSFKNILISGITVYGIVYSLMQWFCMLFGWRVVLKNNTEVMILFSFVIVSYFSLITFPDGGARYRLIFEPLFICSAVFGFFYIQEYIRAFCDTWSTYYFNLRKSV